MVRSEFTEVVQQEGSTVAGVLSPFLTCEEAFLMCKYLKDLSGEVRLFLGPVPVRGEDDTYPKDRHGRPVQPVKFTIRAEKCPNRRGVEEVLRHFQGEVRRWDGVLDEAGLGRLKACFLAAGYPPRDGGWISEEQADVFQNVPFLVLHDLFDSPLERYACVVLPAVTFAERDGTFVNHAGLAQAIHRAVPPPSECRSIGQVFLDLMERRGLMHAPSVRKELAAEMPYYAPLAKAELGDHGVFLDKT